jgi:tetratricopeptide (TPR) repeat protein
MLTDRFPDRLLRPIIAHELVHARRGDIFWGYLQFLAQLIWWFHPLVWWMSKRANDLCERCCDLEVIRSRQCGASDYAESLVRVLELKSSLHAMPLAHSMSPRQITRLRLESIMRFCERTAPSRNSFVSWSLVAGLGLLLLPGMHWARAQNENDSEIEYRMLGEREAKQAVNRAMQVGDWDTVVKVLQPVVEREPENAGATFYLGFALHAQGKYEDALIYHARAADFDSTRSLALYNWACCLALQGRSELALDKLGAALDAGFVARIDVADDPDFQSLTDNPRFQELRHRQLDYRQLDFLAGEWTLHDSTGQILSEHRFRFDEKGHLLKEEWMTCEGGSGSSMLYFHPEDRVWKQTRIRDDGSVAEYVAELGSSQLEFCGKVCSKSGSTLRRKVSLVQSSPTEIEHLVEQSIDEGKSWQTVQVGKLVMKSSLGKPLNTTARQQFFMVSPTEDKLQ